MEEYGVITKAHKIKTCAQRYAEQYKAYPGEPSWRAKHRENIVKLERATSEQQIIEIIGNSTWTENCCKICGKEKDKLLWIESYDFYIELCGVCIFNMQQLLEATE